MGEHRRENVVFGSIIGLVANVIAAICCFFGGNNNIAWLSIVGMIVFVIGILITFTDKVNGFTNLLGTAAAIAAAYFFGDKLTKIYNWIIADGSVNACYFARFALVGIMVSTILLLGAVNIARK